MILLIYGTRPEYIKIKPLIGEMEKRKIPFKTLFTGQHSDIVPKTATYNLTMQDFGGNRLDSVIKNCLSIPENIFDGIKYVLVQGDTTSVVGLALAAFHRGIKVIHLEAGLRTYDNENPYPEENNRRIVSNIASIHLCPTTNNITNLVGEQIIGAKYVVGNTGLDNLKHLKNGIVYGDKILITLHRRENHHWMDQWFTNLSKLASAYPDYEFIFPIHPNPNVQKHKHLLENITVIDPVTHDELLNILRECALVITDSGGLQEECSFFNKKCLVCRKVTERPESLNKSSFLIKTPSDLIPEFENKIIAPKINYDCPFGDGNSSTLICDIFEKLILL